MVNDLTRTVDALPGLVWTAFPDGRAEYVNRRWCEYTGLSVEEAAGEGWQSVVHPDDRPALLECWRTTVVSNKPSEAEARMRRADGEYRWFLVRASPMTDAAGEVVKWCGINTDIEDRKRAEAALRANERCFRLIVDSLPTPVILFAPEGGVLHANRYTLDYAGVTLEELQEWETNGLTHPDDLEAVVARFYASISAGEPYDFESRHRRADGVYRWSRVQGFPLQDDEGRIVLWHFLQTDIDNHKRAEALLAGGKRLLEMVALGLPLLSVLDDLCRLAEDAASGCRCGISLIDADSMTFQRVGAPRLMPGDDDGSEIPVSNESGPYGLAVSIKTQVIVPDIASETRWTQEWRERNVARGWRSCWATPILSRTHEALGSFTLYSSAPGSPTPSQRDLIAQFTHIASIAIERAQSDLALKRSEESFRAIVETTPECVKVIAHDGTLLRVNSAGIGISGAPGREALVGKCFYDFVAPEHRERYIEFNQDICSGKTGFLEFDIITLHGERRHMETHAAPLHSSDGSIVQLGVTRDITARKRADEQLRKSEALMAKVEKLSLSGSFFWCPASGSITWSEQLYRIYGIEPGARITMDMVTARVHPGDLHIVHNTLEQAQDGRNLESDHRLLLPDGSVKYVRMQAHATRDALGQLDYIGAVQDVTDRRQSEEALYGLRAEMAHVSRVDGLGALTASIAHEIIQPLTGIMTNARTGLRMLSAEPPNVDGALETVRRTIRDGQRASEVVTRLRAMFRKEVVMTDAVDLGEAACEVIELMRSDIRRKRIVLRLKTADNLPPITGDKVQLQQVVLNLFLNAIEAMQGVDDRPRQILVEIERDDGDCVRLAVSDSGVGFEPERADELFDAFYTTKREGMGIGLSVSRSIIERHGGRLWATSNERFGATFTFSVPCRAGRMADGNRLGARCQSAGADTEPA
ncbi:PAS domain S-box protein [Cupriavidus sp. D39]|uniref:PAS domain S-box protein n=1 Tax=Cupriavidus sp. D39 TaxID=2997877 RepID=UPI002270F10A|nr:PAS domain S-box protein [Cupriavidus sp. D39]MCY0855147.1 PAS domain S-box protein [Cupriavidus sp. D39]